MLFITVDVEDTEKEEISLTESKLTFKLAMPLAYTEILLLFFYRAIGGVDRKTYAVELEFFEEVVPQVQNIMDSYLICGIPL